MPRPTKRGAGRGGSRKASRASTTTAHRVHRPPGVHVAGEGARAGRRRRTSRAGGRRRRGRRGPRSHAVLRGVGRPDRRHRDAHHRARARSSTSSTRNTGCRARSRAPGSGARRRRSRRPTRSKPRSTASAATASAATTRLPTCCTGRCARCSARTCSRRVRWSAPTACASTSATTSRSRPISSREVERLANGQVISDAPVRHYETTKAEAERIGAIAFFGEKYGDIVRVLEAGPSTELCGGTHVHALGFIGPIKVVSEGSIGSNLRRIEAMTGDGALRVHRVRGSSSCGAPATCCARRRRRSPTRSSACRSRCASLQDELQPPQGEGSDGGCRFDSRASADGGVLVARHDGLDTGELRQLAQETVRALQSGVVVARGRGRRQGGDRGGGQQGPRGAGRGGRRDRQAGGGQGSAAASARARTRSSAAGRTSAGSTSALDRGRELAPQWRSMSDRSDRVARRRSRARGGSAWRCPTVTASIAIAPLRAAAREGPSVRSSGDRRCRRTSRGRHVSSSDCRSRLSGRKGPAARAALTEIDELRLVAGPQFEVVVHDERLTTVTAERALQAARVSKEAQRDVVDKVAAAVMLQSWLDAAAAAAVSISRGQRTAIVLVGLVVRSAVRARRGGGLVLVGGRCMRRRHAGRKCRLRPAGASRRSATNFTSRGLSAPRWCSASTPA